MNIGNFHLYQIAIMIVSIVMIYQGFDRFFKKQGPQTILKLLTRIIVWGGMVLVVLYPKLSTSLAKFIGIEGNINAVILIGFLLVFLMIFKLLSAIERLESQISIITRQDSLKDIEIESKK